MQTTEVATGGVLEKKVFLQPPEVFYKKVVLNNFALTACNFIR